MRDSKQGQLLLEVLALWDPRRALMTHNERVLIDFCNRLGLSLADELRVQARERGDREAVNFLDDFDTRVRLRLEPEVRHG